MEDQNLANSVITVRATPLRCFNKADFPSIIAMYVCRQESVLDFLSKKKKSGITFVR
jgi:hypothetical protein